MDIWIYTADTETLNDPFAYGEAYGSLPFARRQKADRFRFPQDKIRSVGAGLLLQKACRAHGLDGADEKLLLGENDKPYFVDYPDWQFNLSHAGNRVLCALSHVPVGCDLEEIRKADIPVARRFFTKEEVDWLLQESDQNKAFYRLWTWKESFLKCIGRGFSFAPDRFIVLPDEKGISLQCEEYADRKFAFREIHTADGYCSTVCVETYEEINLHTISVAF